MKNKSFSPKLKQLVTITLGMVFTCTSIMAQVKTAKLKDFQIPFEASRFDTSVQKAGFITYKGVKAMKILPGGKQVVLKNFNFINGTIEFDVEPVNVARSDFFGVYFRQKDRNETECVYVRAQLDESKQRNDAVQYTPIIHGINLWDMMGQYQGPAVIHNTDWNHFKLVISGLQMRVYINNSVKPTLQIPRLEGNTTNGTIAFDGNAIFANLVVKPNQTEDLSPVEGADLTDHDVNYIRRWDVSPSKFLEKGRELLVDDLPKDTATWKPIVAERRGLINLTRVFGGVENLYGGVQNKNRYVWLKTTIHSDKDQNSIIQLGFSDEIYVFINAGLLYVDKNQYPQPIRKFPAGRLDIANSSFSIPLKAGDNELIIGVSNYFYGWGIAARMQNMDGISVLQK